MSLISDTNYLIHQLRLSYLRDADDLYGPRIISLDQSYQANPYILASGLADQERWPELNVPSSPNLSETEAETTSGFPGARLKYTETIMGGRSGGLGLRVHGKRVSTSKRVSYLKQKAEASEAPAATKVSNLAPTEGTLSTSAPPVATSLVKPVVKVEPEEEGKPSESPGPNVQIQVATAPEEAPVTKVVQFVPKFSKEMEARRQMRMAARRGPGGPVPPPTSKPLSFDTSSEEEEESEEEELPDQSDGLSEGFGEDAGDSSMDEGDEFDPEFAATRGVMSDSASVNSIMSGNSSMPDSATHNYYRAQPRLSPVTEHRRRGNSRTRPSELNLAPAPKSDTDVAHSKRPNGAIARSKSDNPTSAKHGPSSSISTGTELTFARKTLGPVKPQKSALSSMLALSSGSSNPFSELYAAISGRGQSGSVTLNVYFPHATRPSGKPMDLNIRNDATVEEVIGFALWTYWEEEWEPKLGDGLKEDDPRREQMLSAVGWILRMAELDGEPDDDFPPPDRMVQQNESLESKIQRRPSRTLKSKKPETNKLNVPTAAIPPPSLAGSFSMSALGSVPLSTSLGPSSSHGPQIFLRIRVADNADAVHISTTIPVSAGMYMQEALEMVCRRRKLANPNDYALVVKMPGNTAIMVPLDRTVASLQGNRELYLFKRNMLNTLGLNLSKGIRTTDPNASIFKHMSETPEQQYSSALDYTAAYKASPFLFFYNPFSNTNSQIYVEIYHLSKDADAGHKTRAHTRDRRCIHPSNKAKAVFDHGKTSSYHIKSIADCQQSQKSSAFKLVLNRASGNKRYDFEAESPKMAAEIVHTIRSLRTALERSGTVGRSRRSRQVV
ncbi:hypothetical protein MD484_g1467, partial [Candolleomyces efflorescens]